MQNNKIAKIFIPGLLLIGIGWWFYGAKYNPEKKDQELLVKKELLKKTELVRDLWVNGTDSKLFADFGQSCEQKSASKKRCSLSLLKCILPKSSLRIERKGKNKINFSKIEFIDNTVSELIPAEGARVVMGIEEIKLTLFLESNCNKVFLPKRNYAYGDKKNPKKDKQFDTFERNIFIDKDLIPANGKNISEMQKYCSKRKMQLLESHILDAASFHPVDLRNNRPKYFLQPPLPWTRNFKSEFVYSAQNNPDFEFDKKYCNFIYSKECEKFENNSLPSWMGLKNPLGSLIEVTRNPEDKEKVLVPSSTYYSIHSKWHHLGLRASWTGESYDRDAFNFSPFKKPIDENFNDLKLGFRCMQEEFLK